MQGGREVAAPRTEIIPSVGLGVRLGRVLGPAAEAHAVHGVILRAAAARALIGQVLQGGAGVRAVHRVARHHEPAHRAPLAARELAAVDDQQPAVVGVGADLVVGQVRLRLAGEGVGGGGGDKGRVRHSGLFL